MKNLNKLLILVIALLATNIGHAQQGELLITALKMNNNIVIKFELLNESKVAGIQFDIELDKLQSKSLEKVNCTNSIKSSFAGCSLNGNILRVAMLKENLKALNSGELGFVTLNNAQGVLAQDLVVRNAKIFDASGAGKSIKAVLDYRDIKITNNREMVSRRLGVEEK